MAVRREVALCVVCVIKVFLCTVEVLLAKNFHRVRSPELIDCFELGGNGDWVQGIERGYCVKDLMVRRESFMREENDLGDISR